MLEPSAIVLYVDHIDLCSDFYQELFGITPEKPSPTFRMFTLSNGMGIGLKDKQNRTSKTEGHSNNELAFTVSGNDKVDELFLAWQQKGIKVIEPPASETYGYTFTSVDPEGNRLRVVSLGK